MDPSIFLPYSPANGLPQESKLATYMNRSAATPPRALNQAMGKLSLESSPDAIKKIVVGEFVPVSYFSPGLLPESPESSPPSVHPVHPSQHPAAPSTQVHQENVGGTTYFYSTNSESHGSAGAHNSQAAIGGADGALGTAAGASPYGSQMYAPSPSQFPPMPAKPPAGLASSFYMPETIRAELFARNEQLYLQADPRHYPELPEHVEMYCELAPLENRGGAVGGAPCALRASHRRSGEHFALRRLPAASLAPPAKRLEAWRKIDHPNVVKLHDHFTTKAFNDHSMVLVYEYHPGAVTLASKYLSSGASAPDGFHDPFSNDPDAPRPYTHQKNAMLRAVACGALLPEALLWSLLVQLTAALRAIHAAGLACRSLEPSKVVMAGCRARVSWCGAADALHAHAPDVAQAQQEDLHALGRLALSLAVRSLHCENLPACLDLVARTYSADLKNLILYLLSATARRSVIDLMPMIGARFYTQVEALERRADVCEEQLAREMDNGRLLRILVKLGVVNERPELNMDASWSETGDRYMLKLFRDHLFHAVGADGRPWLDQAHLTHCLNQLDGGANTKVELMSRDEQSVLVVSYAELKHCLETAFDEVMAAAAAPPPPPSLH